MGFHSAFGLTLRTEIPLPGLRSAPLGDADLTIERVDEQAVEAAWSGAVRSPVWRVRFPDGQIVQAELGIGGDQLLTYGDRARFHISRDLRTVSCAIRDERAPHSLRFLLDTVLWWTCLSRGFQVIHASAVESEGGVLAFAGATSGGKTTLAAELLRRGCKLFSDDVLVLERRNGDVVAHPGPPVMNLPIAAGHPSEFGRALAEFADQGETWVGVERASDQPLPIAALFLLRRGEGLSTAVAPLPVTTLDLIPHAWGLPHAVQGPRERFEFVSDLVSSVPVYQLHAAPESSPGALADLVESVATARSFETIPQEAVAP